MGLYDAESEEELRDALSRTPDLKRGQPNHTKQLNLMLLRGTTWVELDRFLDTCMTEQYSKISGYGWAGIKGHLHFCRAGRNNNGRINTWVFNIGNATDEFARPDNPNPSANIRLVGLSEWSTLPAVEKACIITFKKNKIKYSGCP